MKNSKIITYAFINAFATALYVILIASFMYIGNQGIFPVTPSIFVPIAMLMLFVFSAALTGSLVLGKPLMLYLDGKKKEAVLLFISTLLIIFLITIVIFLILVGLNG
ncbi:hypothetical protein J4477_01100 [Candidatus Pacearchaeota archaeon]|nr:hypothetical protein [Candidatus Pacearchaeota archaeon]